MSGFQFEEIRTVYPMVLVEEVIATLARTYCGERKFVPSGCRRALLEQSAHLYRLIL